MDGKLEILPGEGLVDGSEKSGWEGGLDLKKYFSGSLLTLTLINMF